MGISITENYQEMNTKQADLSAFYRESSNDYLIKFSSVTDSITKEIILLMVKGYTLECHDCSGENKFYDNLKQQDKSYILSPPSKYNKVELSDLDKGFIEVFTNETSRGSGFNYDAAVSPMSYRRNLFNLQNKVDMLIYENSEPVKKYLTAKKLVLGIERLKYSSSEASKMFFKLYRV